MMEEGVSIGGEVWCVSNEFMDGVDMVTSIHPFLPLLRKTVSGTLEWLPELGLALSSLARGSQSVHGGKALYNFINDLRAKSQLPLLSMAVSYGVTTYFDEETSEGFFKDVLPFMADLAFRLPLLLNDHFKRSKSCLVPVHLRVLKPQEPGLVYMNQELAAAILSCAFFCLYPTQGRRESNLPGFNFDGLFRRISDVATQQQQKVQCLVHYFTRLSQAMQWGMISFERKSLSRQPQETVSDTPGFDEHYWKKSSSPFCSIQVFEDGLIENQSSDVLEVDFANRFLGGGVLRKGCVQEEIRFVICPELIAGMLFMPAMQVDEAIEIRGVERFSHYTGYSSSFRFAGDYIDTKPRDSHGRLETRIVAIDALRHPGQRQYEEVLLLRETNKALCGFLHHLELKFTGLPSQVPTYVRESSHMELQDHQQAEERNSFHNRQLEEGNSFHKCSLDRNTDDAALNCNITNTISDNEIGTLIKQHSNSHLTFDALEDPGQTSQSRIEMGIATGNWGCGAYGGDVELKSLIQWMAASQAGRPFLHYFTFGSPHGQRLQEVADLIIKERWLVGDVWELVLEYGQKRLQRMHKKGLFEWILPRLSQGNTTKGIKV